MTEQAFGQTLLIGEKFPQEILSVDDAGTGENEGSCYVVSSTVPEDNTTGSQKTCKSIFSQSGPSEGRWCTVKAQVGFDITRKGERSLVVNGYKFTKSRDGMSGRVFWRCSRRECKATAVTVDDHVEHLRAVHSHGPPMAAEFFSSECSTTEQHVKTYVATTTNVVNRFQSINRRSTFDSPPRILPGVRNNKSTNVLLCVDTTPAVSSGITVATLNSILDRLVRSSDRSAGRDPNSHMEEDCTKQEASPPSLQECISDRHEHQPVSHFSNVSLSLEKLAAIATSLTSTEPARLPEVTSKPCSLVLQSQRATICCPINVQNATSTDPAPARVSNHGTLERLLQEDLPQTLSSEMIVSSASVSDSSTGFGAVTSYGNFITDVPSSNPCNSFGVNSGSTDDNLVHDLSSSPGQSATNGDTLQLPKVIEAVRGQISGSCRSTNPDSVHRNTPVCIVSTARHEINPSCSHNAKRRKSTSHLGLDFRPIITGVAGSNHAQFQTPNLIPSHSEHDAFINHIDQIITHQIQNGILVKVLSTVQQLTDKLNADADPPEVIQNCRAIQACLDTISALKRVQNAKSYDEEGTSGPAHIDPIQRVYNSAGQHESSL